MSIDFDLGSLMTYVGRSVCSVHDCYNNEKEHKDKKQDTTSSQLPLIKPPSARTAVVLLSIGATADPLLVALADPAAAGAPF